MYKVYSQHKGANLTFRADSVGEVLEMAEAAAKLGHDAFYRVFRFRYIGRCGAATSEQFETAFSVLNGNAVEWPHVTFPEGHWA